MSETKQKILKLGEQLIREKGYNAFSYQDISGELSIKNAAVHYHFPQKASLAIEVLRQAREEFDILIEEYKHSSAMKKFEQFIRIYTRSSEQNRICLVGAMVTDYSTLDDKVRVELKLIMDDILSGLIAILNEGKASGEFTFKEDARTKALLIITNMIAGLQVARVTGQQDYKAIEKAVFEGLK